MILVTTEEVAERCGEILSRGFSHGVRYFRQEGGIDTPVRFYPYDEREEVDVGDAYLELLVDGIAARKKTGP